MALGEARSSRLRWWLPAVAIVVVAWLAFWLAQGFPVACNLVNPCPDRDVRAAPALLFGGLMFIPLIAVALMTFVRAPVRWLIHLAYVALVALAVVGYGVICFSAGFGVDLPFLAGLLAVCGTAWFAFRGVTTVRRDTQRA